MARGPTYRVPFRRRREGKTNYYLRRKLLISGKLRLVIRPTNKNITCQVVEAHLKGDKILAVAHSKEFEKNYDWKFGTGNIPMAYLTGYLVGKKILKAGYGECIADIGLRVHINRTYAAIKGAIDAGLEIPHSDEIFPPEDRLLGKHIENYAKILASTKNEDDEDADLAGPEHQFKKSKEQGADVQELSKIVNKIKEMIDKQYA
ncbi:MAG: 50S ribosomal protein L18 [Promethearchaeota archaeon]